MVQDRNEVQLRRSYQLLASLGPEGTGLDGHVFVKAVSLLYGWARQQAAGVPLPEHPSTASGSNSKTGHAVAVIYEQEELFFTLRFSAAQNPSDGERNTTELEIRPHDSKLAIAIRTTAIRPAACLAGSVFHLPDFLRPLMKDVGLNDGAPITAGLWTVSCPKVRRFVNFLSASERQLPVIAISQAKNPSIGVNGYAVDPWQCARELAGAAHVAAILWEATFDLSSAVGSEWSCFNGAVRIYWPAAIDFFADAPYAHPLYTLKTINGMAFAGTFEEYLKREVRGHLCKRSVDWSACGVKFYIEAEHLRIAKESGQEPPEQTIRRCQEQISRLYESAQEYAALADAYYGDMVSSQEDSKAMHRQMAALSALINRQRTEILRLKDGRPEKAPLDLSYEELPSWVERYYPDRLFLHPRAVRALKDAVYQNPSMVYRCLVLLAEDYRDYRMGMVSREEFLKRCRAVDPGLTESGCGELSSIGEQGEEYYVAYGGRRCLLDRHLKKGVSHNPLYCLRIYFFWDAGNSMVVIGSLPGHLRSSNT